MANFYGTARSNYFRVKDREAFYDWAKNRGLEILENDSDPNLVGITPREPSDDGCWPSYDPDAPEDNQEIDIVDEVAKHLADGSVAILMQVGSEKLRYLDGWAEAVNAAGDRETVTLRDIYEKSKRLGTEITQATY